MQVEHPGPSRVAKRTVEFAGRELRVARCERGWWARLDGREARGRFLDETLRELFGGDPPAGLLLDLLDWALDEYPRAG